MGALKIVLALICFGLGVALSIGTISTLQSTYESQYAWVPGMFAAMFLLGTFLLLRRKA
jgi:hypothetical protein